MYSHSDYQLITKCISFMLKLYCVFYIIQSMYNVYQIILLSSHFSLQKEYPVKRFCRVSVRDKRVRREFVKKATLNGQSLRILYNKHTYIHLNQIILVIELCVHT